MGTHKTVVDLLDVIQAKVGELRERHDAPSHIRIIKMLERIFPYIGLVLVTKALRLTQPTDQRDCSRVVELCEGGEKQRIVPNYFLIDELLRLAIFRMDVELPILPIEQFYLLGTGLAGF